MVNAVTVYYEKSCYAICVGIL